MKSSFSLSFVPTRISAAFTLAILVVGFFISSVPVSASHYSTLMVSMSGNGTLSMQPGETKSVTVEFQNTGTEIWNNDGYGYVSVYTHGPKYRGSQFDPGTWEWGDHPGRLSQGSVALGNKGTVTFELHAPETEGEYSETFWLAAEGLAWIEGGEFTLDINVSKAAPVKAPVVTETPETDSSTGYDAELLILSANKISTTAGRAILLTAAFKNTGTKTWTSYGVVAPNLNIASASSFTHPSWQGSTLAYATSQSIAPGQTAVIDFAFMAPSSDGTHQAKFQFSANNTSVPGAYIELPVSVTGGSGAIAIAPVVDDVDTTVLNNPALYAEEPLMRIGFLIVDEETDDEVVITSVYSDFELKDVAGNVLASRTKNQTVLAYYYNGLYYYDAGEGLKSTASPLRFEPLEDNAIMRVANFDRRLTRNSKYADNEFRGVFELRYNDYKDRTWLINELSMEYYLRGLAETSNVSPMEYQKSLVTAARTYALYHYTRASKYKNEFFHMSSYSWDQVYNGYGQEVRAPRITEAVIATRGAIVTYDGAAVFTPYFSRSDGRTRNFNEVWNGSYPWLVSVSVPWDSGRALWGHGVGLSAWAALDMANEDYMWDEILKHFYTGIDITQKWE
jgi:hypothetical protein